MALYQVTITAILEADDANDLVDSSGNLDPQAWDDLKYLSPEANLLLTDKEVEYCVAMGVMAYHANQEVDEGLDMYIGLQHPELTPSQRIELKDRINDLVDSRLNE